MPVVVGVVGAGRADRLAAAVEDVGADVAAAEVDLAVDYVQRDGDRVDRANAAVGATGLEPLAQGDGVCRHAGVVHHHGLRERGGEAKRVAEASGSTGSGATR